MILHLLWIHLIRILPYVSWCVILILLLLVLVLTMLLLHLYFHAYLFSLLILILRHFLLNLLSLPFNQLINQLVFINEGVILSLQFREGRVNVLIFNFLQFFIFNLFVHTIKSVLYTVFCSVLQLFNDFRPLISYLLSKFKNFEIFTSTERISVNVWIQKIVPPFSALLTIPLDSQSFI